MCLAFFDSFNWQACISFFICTKHVVFSWLRILLMCDYKLTCLEADNTRSRVRILVDRDMKNKSIDAYR